MVPEQVANFIRQRGFFGYKANEQLFAAACAERKHRSSPRSCLVTVTLARQREGNDLVRGAMIRPEIFAVIGQ